MRDGSWIVSVFLLLLLVGAAFGLLIYHNADQDKQQSADQQRITAQADTLDKVSADAVNLKTENEKQAAEIRSLQDQLNQANQSLEKNKVEKDNLQQQLDQTTQTLQQTLNEKKALEQQAAAAEDTAAQATGKMTQLEANRQYVLDEYMKLNRVALTLKQENEQLKQAAQPGPQAEVRCQNNLLAEVIPSSLPIGIALICVVTLTLLGVQYFHSRAEKIAAKPTATKK